MFVRNIESMNIDRVYKSGRIIGNYLIKNGIPLLSREDKMMVFSRTDVLQEALKTMPFYLRLLRKVGVING